MQCADDSEIVYSLHRYIKDLLSWLDFNKKSRRVQEVAASEEQSTALYRFFVV